MYFMWCIVLDCYKLKVFPKQLNRKLFTRRYITVNSQFQENQSPVKTPLCRGGWRTCWFNAACLKCLPRIH